MNWLLLRYVLSLLTLFLLSGTTATCPEMSVTLTFQIIDQNELISKQHKLDEMYQEYIEKDFKDQVEGIFNEINRNKAIKVAFAKKRLKKAIEKKKSRVFDLTYKFCEKCNISRTTGLNPHVYCARCPTMPVCKGG